MNTQKIPAYVINLDRRDDRRKFIADEMKKAGIEWTRVSAVDAQTATDKEIAVEVNLEKQRIGMGRGSQCCAITNFNIYRDLSNSDHAAALILQDDVAIDPALRSFLTDLDWLPENVGVVQFEKYGRSHSQRLAGPASSCGKGERNLHRLYSRTAGAGCYLITSQAAAFILENKPLLDMPIDHLLFSPNVSPLFKKLGVAFVTPALAVQLPEIITSDLSAERRSRGKGNLRRLRRLWQELNDLPSQVVEIAKGARMVDFGVPDILKQELPK